MTLIHNDTVGLTLYARFDNAGNTAIDFTEGTTLKQGRYTISTATLVSNSIAAGVYSVRVFVGTAAAQAATDVLRGSIDYSFDGTNEITLKTLQDKVDVIDGIVDAILVDTANMDGTTIPAISALCTSIQADTDDLQTTLAGFSGGLAGPGADSCTITIETDGAVPVGDCDVWLTSDLAGDVVVAGSLRTNAAGEATFLLDAGVTYYLWAEKSGVISIQGEVYVAVAD